MNHTEVLNEIEKYNMSQWSTEDVYDAGYDEGRKEAYLEICNFLSTILNNKYNISKTNSILIIEEIKNLENGRK